MNSRFSFQLNVRFSAVKKCFPLRECTLQLGLGTQLSSSWGWSWDKLTPFHDVIGTSGQKVGQRLKWTSRVESYSTPRFMASPAAAYMFRAGSVQGPCLVRYKVMSILMGPLSRTKLTISDKSKDNLGAYCFIIHSKILDCPVSRKRCILDIIPLNAKVPCAVAIQIER